MVPFLEGADWGGSINIRIECRSYAAESAWLFDEPPRLRPLRRLAFSLWPQPPRLRQGGEDAPPGACSHFVGVHICGETQIRDVTVGLIEDDWGINVKTGVFPSLAKEGQGRAIK